MELNDRLMEINVSSLDRTASVPDIELALLEVSVIECLESQEYEVLNELVDHITSSAFVCDLNKQGEQDYDSSDFLDVLEATPQCFSCLKVLLSKLRLGSSHLRRSYKMVMSILKLCGTHSQANFLWSSEAASSSISGILQCILNLTGYGSLMNLLCAQIEGHSYTLFKSMLLSMRPSLKEDTWTLNPSSCQIFKWLLVHVQHPHLVDYLTDVLPPSLMFISHYSTTHKVLGIQCLDHIIENVPPTELKLYGRADVVYDGLSRLLYEKESEIICVLYPCLLKLLSGQNRDLQRSQKPRLWSSYDEMFHQLLWNMSLENHIIIRQAYSAQLSEIINKLGITVCKHMKRLKNVLLDYLSVPDGPKELSRINALDSLIALIRVAWPRFEHHCSDFLKSILILVHDIETDDIHLEQTVKEAILSRCKMCCVLLEASCPSKYAEYAVPEILLVMPELKTVLDMEESSCQ